MAKKRKKEPPKHVMDDNGIEREIGKVYEEKFTYEGNANTFLLIWSDEHVIPVICERDVIEALTDLVRDMHNFGRQHGRRKR